MLRARTAFRGEIMRLKKGIASYLLLAALCCVPVSASALGLGFGAKAGYGSGSQKNNDQDLTTFMAVGNFDLVLFAVEGNLGWLRGQSQEDDKSFVDELSAVVLAKLGIPLVPALLSVDFGAGLDQRLVLGAEVAGQDAKLSGRRTLIPLSLQVTGSVLLARLYGEIRYNYELSNTLEADGEEVDADPRNELLFLVGATF